MNYKAEGEVVNGVTTYMFDVKSECEKALQDVVMVLEPKINTAVVSTVQGYKEVITVTGAGEKEQGAPWPNGVETPREAANLLVRKLFKVAMEHANHGDKRDDYGKGSMMWRWYPAFIQMHRADKKTVEYLYYCRVLFI